MENRPDIAEKIRKVSDFPRDAFKEARHQRDHVRTDWKDVNIAMVCTSRLLEIWLRQNQMDIALEHKFSQHRDLRQELLMTGDAELVEVLASQTFYFSCFW